jgi:hypothetical protein
MATTGRLDEDRDRAFRTSAWKIHRDGIDSTALEPIDVGLHRCRIA